MNKNTMKKLLAHAIDTLPLSTLGVIEGLLEDYNDGQIDIYQLADNLENVMAAFRELSKEQERELMEPCLSE